jgi:hypothetical protein
MRRGIKWIVGALLVLLVGGVGAGQRVAKPTSLVRIIADPDKFDGQTVATVGFVEFADGQTTLYLHQVDRDARLLPNALSIQFASDRLSDKDRKRFNLKYVYVPGTFDAKDRGPKGEELGSIDGWMIAGWPNSSNPEP